MRSQGYGSQIGEGAYLLHQGVPAGDVSVRSEQAIPGGRSLGTHQSATAVLALRLHEPSRSMGQASISAHFVSKLTDADGENSETDTSLDFAQDCGYLAADEHTKLTQDCCEVGKMLGSMLANPGLFLLNPL